MLFHGSQLQDENATAAAPSRARPPLDKAGPGAGAAPRARRALGDITNGAINARAPGKTGYGKPVKEVGQGQRLVAPAPAAVPRPAARPLGAPSRAAILAARWAAEGEVEASAGRTWEAQRVVERRQRDLDAAARLDLLASDLLCGSGRAGCARSWSFDSLSSLSRSPPPSPVRLPRSPPPSPARLSRSPPPRPVSLSNALASSDSCAPASPCGALGRLALSEGDAIDDLCLWEDELWDDDSWTRSRASLEAC